MISNRTVGAQEVDFRIFAVSVLNRLSNIDLVPVLERLKNANMKRLKEMRNMLWKLKRNDFVPPAVYQEGF
jgi:hypothetical protein